MTSDDAGCLVRAAATIACASGCPLPLSTAAAVAKTAAGVLPAAGTTSVTAGLPTVRVPVLSNTMKSTLRKASSASAFFTRIPCRAPKPIPTITDIGVASPNAQGHATSNTAMALSKPNSQLPAIAPQTSSVIAAAAITSGTIAAAT
ncbi:hypothetical protein SDC9_166869 [bioreactor metagenome]|uniref:Uncharacterized protein n=1 Tax=bioreactor metagenome TaxID=1076179 RepID=A0A645FY73_9ZZZZ